MIYEPGTRVMWAGMIEVQGDVLDSLLTPEEIESGEPNRLGVHWDDGITRFYTLNRVELFISEVPETVISQAPDGETLEVSNMADETIMQAIEVKTNGEEVKLVVYDCNPDGTYKSIIDVRMNDETLSDLVAHIQKARNEVRTEKSYEMVGTVSTEDYPPN